MFTVDLENQPGELARLCEAMPGRGINLVLSAAARENGATVVFIADGGPVPSDPARWHAASPGTVSALRWLPPRRGAYVIDPGVSGQLGEP